MAVSLVMYFNPAAKNGGGSGGYRSENLPVINGKRVSDSDFDQMQRQMRLRLLNQKGLDINSAEVQSTILQYLFIESKCEQLGIVISDEAAGRLARRLLGSTSLQQFVDERLKSVQLDQADFANYCRFELASAQLRELAGLSGRLVVPAEAEALYRAQNQAVAASMVFFPLSNYLSQVSNAPGEVESFYTNELDHYVIPDRVVISYVKFDASNYLAAARMETTNLDQNVEDYLKEAGTNLPEGASTPAEARVKIRDRILLNVSLQDAARAANALVEDLDKAGAHGDAIDAAGKRLGLTVHTTAPFDKSGPTNLTVPAAFVQAAFTLSDETPFSSIVPAEDGIYVLAFRQRIPSSTPAFKDVEAKVTADLRDDKAHQLALDAASAFDKTVEDQLNVNNGITLPKDFPTIAADNGMTLEPLPPLALTTTNLPKSLEERVGLSTLRSAALNTPIGTASKAVPAPGGAFVVYVEKAIPLDETKLKTDLPRVLENMRDARAYEAYQNWMNLEINREPDLAKQLIALQKSVLEREQAAQPQGR
jgi:hypothetical protein